jgi:hypothetical protein
VEWAERDLSPVSDDETVPQAKCQLIRRTTLLLNSHEATNIPPVLSRRSRAEGWGGFCFQAPFPQRICTFTRKALYYIHTDGMNTLRFVLAMLAPIPQAMILDSLFHPANYGPGTLGESLYPIFGMPILIDNCEA